MSIWTPALVNRVVELWNSGKSASAIALLIGNGKVSRSAVIGKISRLRGVHPDMRGYSSQEHSRNSRKGGAKSQFNQRKKRAAETLAENKPAAQSLPRLKTLPPIPPCETDVSRKSLLQLEAGDCRWPVGDPGRPGFGFCAAEAVPGQSYCEHHARRAFAPPTPRQRPPAETKELVEA